MRRRLGSAAVLLLLLAAGSACGSSGSDDDARGSDSPTPGASGPSSPGPSSPDPSSPGSSDTPSAGAGELVEIVSGTAAGGETGPAVRLDLSGGVASLTRAFAGDPLAARVRSVVSATDVPPGQALYGAVVAIGCDVPPGASVEVSDGEVVITPDKVPSPLPECLAAVTSVAIVLVPAAGL